MATKWALYLLEDNHWIPYLELWMGTLARGRQTMRLRLKIWPWWDWDLKRKGKQERKTVGQTLGAGGL